jgi:three-Cys-motif partner protein
MSGVIAADGYIAREGGLWTRDKLTYVRNFGQAFMSAMAPKGTARKWGSLVFIDLLCGPGIDVIDGVEHQGSPLTALSIRPAFDRLFLGDIDEQNVNALRHRIAPEDASRVDLRAADCHSRAREVISQVDGRTLAFAFVDPEGFEVDFELFATLATRRVDILFLFPSGIGVKRNLQRFANLEISDLDALMGTHDWRALPAVRRVKGEMVGGAEAEQRDESLVRFFCERVKTLGYPHYAATHALRNSQNTPMYHLLFFSKAPIALTIWQNVSKIDPGGQRRLGDW